MAAEGVVARGRGERYYQAYRKAKNGRTRTGAVMGLWAEMSPAFQRAWIAAAEAAAEGKAAAECYAVYIAARSGNAFDGTPAPAWEGLQDQAAWTTAGEALRGG